MILIQEVKSHSGLTTHYQS